LALENYQDIVAEEGNDSNANPNSTTKYCSIDILSTPKDLFPQRVSKKALKLIKK